MRSAGVLVYVIPTCLAVFEVYAKVSIDSAGLKWDKCSDDCSLAAITWVVGDVQEVAMQRIQKKAVNVYLGDVVRGVAEKKADIVPSKMKLCTLCSDGKDKMLAASQALMQALATVFSAKDRPMSEVKQAHVL